MQRFLAFALTFALAPAALAQGPGAPQSMPMAVDLKKVAVGSWAEYAMSYGDMKIKSRWALVARDAKSNTLEMTMNNPAMGPKVTVKMVLDGEPTTAANPVKELVMQFGDQDPMLAPPGAPVQKFKKPDPNTVVGKETVKVAAGTFKTTHYRDKVQAGSVDVWVSDEVAPLGLVKVLTTPDAKQGTPGTAVMELQATGKGAKPTVTKPAKPFDPQQMMGGGPAPRPSKPPKKN